MSVLGLAVPPQVVFNGALTGLTFGLAAVAVILVYRSSRVINLATAEMGGFAAAVLAYLVVNHGMGYWPALVVSIVVGGAVGAAIDVVVVRRLSGSPRIMLLVATIGLSQLLLLGQTLFPDPKHVVPYPTPFASRWNVGGVIVRGEHVVILVAMPLVVGALALFLTRTRVGLAVRAAAANPSAARLAGVRVRRTSTLVWAMAGAFTALATILAAPFTTTTSSDLFTLGPSLLVRVLAAALIGGMSSFGLALVGGVLIGVVDSVVFYNAPTARGLTDLVVFGIVIVTLVLWRRRESAEASADWSFAPRSRASGATLGPPRIGRAVSVVAGLACVALALSPLVLADTASQQFAWSKVALYAMAALSLTLLTGWTGQLSIGQFAFVGIGAMTATALIREGVGPGPVLVAAAVVGAVAAVVVGVPSLRLPGVFMAASTLALGVATSSWVLSRYVFLQGRATATFPRLLVGNVSLESQRTYYAVSLLFLAVAMFAMSRLRRTSHGRAFIAVRSNGPAAQSFGLSPTRTKLTAFAISGGLAGLTGALLAGLLVTVSPQRFSGAESLQLISIAVIGGLASVPGTVAGAAFVIGIPALFPDNTSLPLLTSGIGVLVLILFLPGGIAALGVRIKDAMVRMLARPDTEGEAPRSVDATSSDGRIDTVVALRPKSSVVHADVEPVALTVSDLSVRRGELMIVRDVDISVEVGEIVGLIGNNGAGKSTIMDAVGGFLPSRGHVHLGDVDLGPLSPARRARAGLGRTYQGAELFGDLTVLETVQVAVDRRHQSDVLSVMVGLPHTWRREHRSRLEAEQIVDTFGLGPMARRYVDELSTGTRRMLELACVVAQQPRMICLDEPTAGMAQRDVEALAPVLVRLREEIGVSLLVIEHDMPFLCSISDRLYCLDFGAIISQGTPDEVRRDPLVTQAYLGSDEAAINRSGASGRTA